MPSTTRLAEDEEGTLKQRGNETLTDSKVDDAAAFRGGAPATQRTVVKYGGDVVIGDRREEVGQTSFKQSESHNVVDGRLGGEWYMGLRKPGSGSVDSGMQDIARAFPENTHPQYPQGVVVFEVPIEAPGIGQSNSNGHVTRFYTDGGKFLINWQDDQDTVRAVIYRVFYKPDGTEDHVEAVGEKTLWP